MEADLISLKVIKNIIQEGLGDSFQVAIDSLPVPQEGYEDRNPCILNVRRNPFAADPQTEALSIRLEIQSITNYFVEIEALQEKITTFLTAINNTNYTKTVDGSTYRLQFFLETSEARVIEIDNRNFRTVYEVYGTALSSASGTVFAKDANIAITAINKDIVYSDTATTLNLELYLSPEIGWMLYERTGAFEHYTVVVPVDMAKTYTISKKITDTFKVGYIIGDLAEEGGTLVSNVVSGDGDTSVTYQTPLIQGETVSLVIYFGRSDEDFDGENIAKSIIVQEAEAVSGSFIVIDYECDFVKQSTDVTEKDKASPVYETIIRTYRMTILNNGVEASNLLRAEALGFVNELSRTYQISIAGRSLTASLAGAKINGVVGGFETITAVFKEE